MEHSGRWGAIDGVAALRQWTIQEGYTTNKSAASNTAQGHNRTRGIFDWTGSYGAYGAVPAAMPGDYQTLEAYKAPDATNDETNGEIFNGEIYIISSVITWNFATNELISYVNNFGGNGALSITAGAPPADASSVDELTPCAGKIATWNGTTADRIPHVTQAVLTITREAKTTVNSGTSAGSGACTTKRQVGGPVDWTLAITTEDGNENALLASGLDAWFRCYVDGSEFWDLKWGLLGPRTGITVDDETGNIISQTHNAEMKGAKAGVLGLVHKPGAVAWWPAP